MERILLASSGEKSTALLIKLLKETFPECAVSVVATGLEARRTVSGNDFESIVINAPLADEFGTDLAEIVTSGSNANCIMLVKSESADIISDKVEDMGVMVIAKPLSKQLFYRSMRFANAARKRMLGIQNENIKLQKKLEDIRTLNRAKFALMQYLSFTEQQAHHYLEKQAMDKRCSKIEVAQNVIKMYEV